MELRAGAPIFAIGPKRLLGPLGLSSRRTRARNADGLFVLFIDKTSSNSWLARNPTGQTADPFSCEPERPGSLFSGVAEELFHVRYQNANEKFLSLGYFEPTFGKKLHGPNTYQPFAPEHDFHRAVTEPGVEKVKMSPYEVLWQRVFSIHLSIEWMIGHLSETIRAISFQEFVESGEVSITIENESYEFQIV